MPKSRIRLKLWCKQVPWKMVRDQQGLFQFLLIWIWLYDRWIQKKQGLKKCWPQFQTLLPLDVLLHQRQRYSIRLRWRFQRHLDLQSYNGRQWRKESHQYIGHWLWQLRRFLLLLRLCLGPLEDWRNCRQIKVVHLIRCQKEGGQGYRGQESPRYGHWKLVDDDRHRTRRLVRIWLGPWKRELKVR